MAVEPARQQLRNRIAHHEPVFERDLRGDFRQGFGAVNVVTAPADAKLQPHGRR